MNPDAAAAVVGGGVVGVGGGSGGGGGGGGGAICTSDSAYQIQQELTALKRTTQNCGLEMEKTRQLQEQHSINFYKHHQLSGKTIIGTYKYNSNCGGKFVV